jgi:hypothetical protein
MGYDHEVADRIRGLVAGAECVAEQRMFGDLAFLIDGSMSVSRVRISGGAVVSVLKENPRHGKTTIDPG